MTEPVMQGRTKRHRNLGRYHCLYWKSQPFAHYRTSHHRCHGMVLCPGFIDPHTHTTSDLSDSLRSQQLNYLFQGVTTVFTGNDGRSPDIGKAYQRWETQGIGTNAASFIGHGTIRSRVLKMENREPTAAELEQMKAMVRQAMEAGAWGLSTGLFYAPGSFAQNRRSHRPCPGSRRIRGSI